MAQVVLLDTGPLVAYLDPSDGEHEWAVAEIGRRPPPLLTCEPVLTETLFLTSHLPGRGVSSIAGLIARDAIRVPFRLGEEFAALARMMERYSNVPMSLADACLVRMSELQPNSTILTLDCDFKIYRRNRTQRIPLIAPE